MFGAKSLFYALSRSDRLRQLASRYGMTSPDGFARRFVAGETIEEVVEIARALQAAGFHLTLDYLGESVSTLEEADVATREYGRLMHVLLTAGIERNISLKLTQLGLTVDRATCIDNLRRILEPGRAQGVFVRIDMESSAWTEPTLEVFETLWEQEYRNVGIVLQSALHRTEQDVRRMNTLGARVRLVKGAYKEREPVAYKLKSDVDAAYARLMRLLLDDGVYPAIATHDATLIEDACAYAAARGITRDRFEFQMLYGVRRDLQTRIVSDGYTMRLYVPFGRAWFPYVMRRLGERPANVAFVAKALLGERVAR